MSSIEHPTTSPSNLQPILNAMSDYANLTGIDLSKNPFAEKFQFSNSPDSILELLRERENAFKEYRDGNGRLINSLSPAVQVLHAFSGILNEAVDFVPFPPAKAVIVGIDVLLAAASSVTSSYDALLELFECFGNFLKRLDICTKIPVTPTMTDIIVQIMVELLSVLAIATKQIRQGRFKKFAKKLLGGSEVEGVLHRLDRLTQDEVRMTVVQTLGVIHGLVNNMRAVLEGEASGDGIRQTLVTLHRMVNDMNKMKRNQLQKDVQHWLSPPDPSTNHDFVLEARHEGTASWLFESKVLADWKAKGSLLWIHGKPGSGKSTLLSSIIEDIEGMRSAGLATMAYYYLDFRDVKKQTRNGLLSSLLSQLSAESESYYEILSQLYLKNAEGLRKPTSIALTKCLKDMLSSPRHGQFYLIVDALDECPNVSGTPSPREQVLKLVEELVALDLPNVRLCVASRPEADIRRVLEPLTSSQISLHDETGQKADIMEYIKSVVRSDKNMQKWGEEDRQLVIDALSGRVDGTFRWVVCQIDRLRRAFPASLRSTLANLPESLDETYEQTLSGIDEEKRKYVQRLFQCLMASIRPLRVEELAAILAVQFDQTAPPTYNPNWKPADARDAVLSACSSLISIVNHAGLQIIQFSHFSVKEFLTSERLAAAEEHLSCYHILPEPAHTILARASLSVLLQLDDKVDRNTISNFPLAQYAARYWVDHAQFGDVSSHIQDVMERLFDPAKPHFAAWVWLYDIDHHLEKPMQQICPTEPDAVPLYYASLCGFRDLVEHWLVSHSSDVNCRGGSHATPLHAASFEGHSEVVLLLLKKGADPNSRDYSGRVPLHKVAQAGHPVIRESSLEAARLLIKSGATANITDEQDRTPLHIAARNGHRDIVELLLESGARTDSRNATQETPLKLACENGKLDVALFLLDRGSDMNALNNDDWTPFHSASRYGHVDIVHLLIDRGADVNLPLPNNHWTPLHLASANGHLEVAKLLIQHGATVDGRNDDGETPLSQAAKNGHLDIAHLLVEHGAAISSRDRSRWIPLHMASQFGHLHVVKFLLERGCDVDIRTEHRDTSLNLASNSGKFEVVRFLIAQGAKIHARNESSWDPLHAASHNGHLDVVQLLIDSGTDVDIRSGSQRTPLAFASSEGQVEVARFLIEKGADINAGDNQGWAPLHLASQYGHFDIVQLLLDSGVDVNVQVEGLRAPLHLSLTQGHLKITRLLIQHGAEVDALIFGQQTPLYQAADNGEVEIVRFLIDHGANVHATDSQGYTPLHAASLGGHLAVVKLLLGRGADLEVLNDEGKTAGALTFEVAQFLAEYQTDATVRNKVLSKVLSNTLGTTQHSANASMHTASEEGRIDVVKFFLDHGVDVDVRNETDQTPLNRAAAKGQLDVVRFLIEQGADVGAYDWLGWTPLHCASRYGHPKVSRVLIEHGANVNRRTADGWTPILLSAGNGYTEIVQLLLERGADIYVMREDGETPYQLSLRRGDRETVDLLREYDTRGG